MEVLNDTGLMKRLTSTILRDACGLLNLLQQSGYPHLRMSVNLSAAQFQQPDLLELLDGAIDEGGFSPDQLELEITEHTLLDWEFCRSNAEKIAERGIRLAIDDFGTGYSSLTYLKQLNVNTLKIDQSFVKNLGTDLEDAQIVQALIGLSRNLGLACIAEGVENNQQMEFLRANHCDIAQGYLVSHPLTAGDVIKWVETYHRDGGL